MKLAVRSIFVEYLALQKGTSRLGKMGRFVNKLLTLGCRPNGRDVATSSSLRLFVAQESAPDRHRHRSIYPRYDQEVLRKLFQSRRNYATALSMVTLRERSSEFLVQLPSHAGLFLQLIIRVLHFCCLLIHICQFHNGNSWRH